MPDRPWRQTSRAVRALLAGLMAIGYGSYAIAMVPVLLVLGVELFDHFGQQFWAWAAAVALLAAVAGRIGIRPGVRSATA